MNNTVAAVIVTYNRVNLLQECVAAIRNQTVKTDAIIVVNNGSTDGTKEWLDAQTDLIVYNQQNLGGAGGFYTGIKNAYEHNFDWAWVMDDDGYPAPNCLEELKKAIIKKPEVDVWGCVVLDRDDHSKLAFICDAITTAAGEIDKSIEFVDNWAPFFNGIMLSKETIKKFGYPNPALFIWGDEVDYLYTILKGGDVIKSTTKAVFYHPKDRLYDVKYRDQYVYSGAFNWRAYCYFRNKAYIGRKFYKSFQFKYLLNHFRYYYKTLPFNQFLNALSLVLNAHWDGFNGNLKKKLPY
jgi:rhamnopyranosyl-N-acetylglucosaminyl-diphospho-decaprenol beta-1,3/1,4-galactofuranosyltransferase